MLREPAPREKMPMTSDRAHSVPYEAELQRLRERVQELELGQGRFETGNSLVPSFEVESYREILEHSLSGYALQEVIFDANGNLRDLIFLEVNRAFEAMTGLPATEVVGRRITECMPGIDLRHLREAMAWLEGGDREPYRFEQFVESLGRHLEFAAISPRTGQCSLFVTDITDRKRAEKALEVQEVYFRELFEKSPLAIVILDNDDCVQECNEGFERLFGYPRDAARGKPISKLLVRPEEHEAAQSISRKVLMGEVVDTEGIRLRRDGTTLDVRILAHPIKLGDENLGIYGIYSDISRHKRDSLTRLPNRSTFMERVELELERACREEHMTALLAIDIEHLKDVNDTYGLGVGDALLVSVAERIRETLRTGATVGRLGGDEFGILQMDLTDVGNAAGLARRILAAIEPPFHVEGHRIHVRVSIGIALAAAGELASKQLLSQAERALEQAKLGGRSIFKFHAADMDRQVKERMILGQELHGALERNELFLVYQPQIELPSRRIIGFEALLRWQHPTKGLVPPDHFIPVAEASGVIIPIGDWVLRTACLQAKRWQEEMALDLPVAVNLSAVQFKNPFFADTVVQALQDTGLPADLLELELTEGILIEATAFVKSSLKKLRDLGVRFALDDFGKGYSSLEYLRQLPLERIKIDRSFVRNLERDDSDAAIVSAISVLGSRLGLRVLAEGVERSSQLDLLAAEGCHEIQGYYFSPPIEPDGISRLLREGSESIRPSSFDN